MPECNAVNEHDYERYSADRSSLDAGVRVALDELVELAAERQATILEHEALADVLTAITAVDSSLDTILSALVTSVLKAVPAGSSCCGPACEWTSW